ncbi:MAG TPA: hypothetical protein PKA00_03165 [Saprospiraceae bacterium]|nr:hypothetical protein [Saprospiraceae bacterium]HMQ81875.1 hypothetical protein [Saprospiraceae bacterium]
MSILAAMKNSLLFKTWIALPEVHCRQIAKAVRSPLFNQRKDVILLLDFLEKRGVQSLSKTNNHLAKEAAFRFVYGAQEQFEDGKIRHLMAHLMDIIRQYLAWQEWRNDSNQIHLHLCRSLGKMGLNDHWEKELQRAKNHLEKASLRNDDYYFQQFLIEREIWELGRQKYRSGIDNVATINHAFAVFVAVHSLRQGCTLLAQKNLTNVSAMIPYLSETLRLIAEGHFEDIAVVATWHASYWALKAPDQEEHFTQLKGLLEANAAFFSNTDLRDLYILAINVCIRRINAADKKYRQEAFDLYRSGLSRGVFLENGYLSKVTYRNVLNIAVSVGELDWALDYLNTFKAYLPPKDQENIFRYNLATYFFRIREYDQAMTLLPFVEMRDMLENFDVRRMMVRIYYEQGEMQALESLLDSFEAYLRRHREGGYHREMYHNFVRFLKKIIALPHRDAIAWQKLQAEISQTKYLAEREWLLSVKGGRNGGLP